MYKTDVDLPSSEVDVCVEGKMALDIRTFDALDPEWDNIDGYNDSVIIDGVTCLYRLDDDGIYTIIVDGAMVTREIIIGLINHGLRAQPSRMTSYDCVRG